ncbi:MAG: FixH family protein [Defluviicoccus sp.]|nr:FixH family protein [Defluviicoccus sp.]MDE0382366.1 FixH family protein [Defluviicoccus sp.]
MVRTALAIAAAVSAALWTGGAATAERAKATVECAPTAERLVYDCKIVLMGRKSGQPLAGAKLVVGADMPSMPLAHNVRPVTAAPGEKPGMYEARIELEMHGEWALRLDVSGPLRDRLIHKMHFGGAKGAETDHKHHMKK